MTTHDLAPGPDDERPAALPLIPASSGHEPEPDTEPVPARHARASTARPWLGRQRAAASASSNAHDVHDVLHGAPAFAPIHDAARPPPRRASAAFMRTHPLHLVSLGFGTGLSPFAPGLVGALFGWFSFDVLSQHVGAAGWLTLIAAGFLLGIAATGFTARALDAERPRAVVWDRIVAVWIVMLFVTPAGFAGQLGAFVLLRGVSALKPPPIRYIDRRLKGGFGIMTDDLVAAFVTLFVIAMWRSLSSTSR